MFTVHKLLLLDICLSSWRQLMKKEALEGFSSHLCTSTGRSLRWERQALHRGIQQDGESQQIYVGIRFGADIRRNFFPTRTSQKQSRLHGNFGQALFMEVFQLLTVAMSNLGWSQSWSCTEQETTDLPRPFPPWVTQWSYVYFNTLCWQRISHKWDLCPWAPLSAACSALARSLQRVPGVVSLWVAVARKR